MAKKTTAEMISQEDNTDQKAVWFEQLQQSLAPLDGQLMLMIHLCEYTIPETRKEMRGFVEGTVEIPTGRQKYYNSLDINSAQLNGEIAYNGNNQVEIPLRDLYTWGENRGFFYYGGPKPASENDTLAFPLSSGQYVTLGKPVLLWNGYQLLGRDQLYEIKEDGASLELILVGNDLVSGFFGVEECADTINLFTAYAKSQGHSKSLLQFWQKSLTELKRNPKYEGNYVYNTNWDASSKKYDNPLRKSAHLLERTQLDLLQRVKEFVLDGMYLKLGIPAPRFIDPIEKEQRDLVIRETGISVETYNAELGGIERSIRLMDD